MALTQTHDIAGRDSLRQRRDGLRGGRAGSCSAHSDVSQTHIDVTESQWQFTPIKQLANALLCPVHGHSHVS
jgi:hypothetical protein